eukprot:SAG31_NODE_39423_length_288_cov_0.857143_1_plen_29_part_01
MADLFCVAQGRAAEPELSPSPAQQVRGYF